MPSPVIVPRSGRFFIATARSNRRIIEMPSTAANESHPVLHLHVMSACPKPADGEVVDRCRCLFVDLATLADLSSICATPRGPTCRTSLLIGWAPRRRCPRERSRIAQPQGSVARVTAGGARPAYSLRRAGVAANEALGQANPDNQIRRWISRPDGDS